MMDKHVHADLMLQYAMETDKPWERWEVYGKITGRWIPLSECFPFLPENQYRRKPKILSVTLMDGEVLSWPEPYTGALLLGTSYWSVGLTEVHHHNWRNSTMEQELKEQGLLYLVKEDAKEALVARQLIFTQGM